MRPRRNPAATARRTFALEDIAVRSGGDGRTVEAYAAVFDVEVTVSDFEGRGYREVIRRGTFTETIAGRVAEIKVMYNHGLDIYGNPAAEFAKPVGVTLEMSEDGRGLRTVTRYSRTPLGDEILTLIDDGAITAQSFGGTWLQSNPQRGPYRAGQLVERTKFALREYGPTPFPVFTGAAIVGVRSITDLADDLAGLTPDERAELARIIAGSPEPTSAAAVEPGSAEGETPDPDDDEPPEAAEVVDPTDELELRRRRLAL